MLLQIHGDSPHPKIATLHDSISAVYQSQGDYSSALDCYQKCLYMLLQIHGDSLHPDIATSHNNIGAVYQSQGDYSSALTRYRRGLSTLPPGPSASCITAISENIQLLEHTMTTFIVDMVRVLPSFTVQSINLSINLLTQSL